MEKNRRPIAGGAGSENHRADDLQQPTPPPQTAQRLSNRLTALAEDVKLAAEAFAVAERASAEHALNAGRLLAEAKEACRHGGWLPFLKRAGVAERSAQRWMKLHRTGLKSDTVSDLGGPVRALSVVKQFEDWVDDLAGKCREYAASESVEAEPAAKAANTPHLSAAKSVNSRYLRTRETTKKTPAEWAEIISASYSKALVSFSEELSAAEGGGAS